MSTLFAISAIVIPKAHTIIAGLAFSTALLMGWASGIWKELCENAVSGHEDASKCNLGHAYQSMLVTYFSVRPPLPLSSLKYTTQSGPKNGSPPSQPRKSMPVPINAFKSVRHCYCLMISQNRRSRFFASPRSIPHGSLRDSSIPAPPH